MERLSDGARALVLDFSELLARVDNDRDLLYELLALFKQESSELLSTLKQAVLEEDMKCVETTGHSLKGMLANLCAKNGAAAAAKLEAIGRAGEKFELKDALRIFESEMALVLPSVDSYLNEERQ